MQIWYLFFLVQVFELVAAVTATLTYSRYSHSKERYFLPFLWGTFLMEVASIVWQFMNDGPNKLWILNVYMILSFLFYFYWYHSVLIWKTGKSIVKVCALVFIAVAIYQISSGTWSEYLKYAFVTGAIGTLAAAVMHFHQLLNSDQVLVLKYKLEFWISTGLLLFNIGMVPFMLLSDKFNFSTSPYYMVTILLLNFVLYGCYTIGFIWNREKYNRF